MRLTETQLATFRSAATEASQLEVAPDLLTKALQPTHNFVPAIIAAAGPMITEIERRGWV